MHNRSRELQATVQLCTINVGNVYYQPHSDLYLVHTTPKDLMPKPLYVTQPHLPPLEDFIPYLQSMWDSKVLTNCGPLHQQFETALCEHLGLQHTSLCTNATTGLIIALRALGISDEVITTPYSFVATSHSILWNGLKPVFVDIDPNTLNIDPHKITEAITEKTTAILATHCYGVPCDTEVISKIAKKYNLKVIYDAAHSFGVKDDGGSILRHGDLSVISFHATKVFNTFEGGAIFSPSLQMKHYIDRLKNFGFTDETSVETLGINGKMTEINSALGLLQLKHIEQAISKRRIISEHYITGLKGIEGIKCHQPPHNITYNHSYFPIMIGPDFRLTRDQLYTQLKDHDIHTRRYFYPLISSFSMYKELITQNYNNMTNAANAANSVLCLPIYPNLSKDDVMRIIKIIHQNS